MVDDIVATGNKNDMSGFHDNRASEQQKCGAIRLSSGALGCPCRISNSTLEV